MYVCKYIYIVYPPPPPPQTKIEKWFRLPNLVGMLTDVLLLLRLLLPLLLSTLILQEIRKNVKPGTLRVMTFEGSVERDVPLSRVNVPGASVKGFTP